MASNGEDPRRRRSDSNGAKLLAWLPLVVVALATAVGWGVQSERVQGLDQRVAAREATAPRMQEIDRKQGVIEERTLAIQRELQEVKRLIERALRRADIPAR